MKAKPGGGNGGIPPRLCAALEPLPGTCSPQRQHISEIAVTTLHL